jgi:hypothetical protein
VVVMEDVRTDPRLPASIRIANEREGIRSGMTATIRVGVSFDLERQIAATCARRVGRLVTWRVFRASGP